MIEINEQRLGYPRVSEINGKQNTEEMRSIPLDILVKASIRGTQVHAYCTTWMKNLFLPDMEPEYKPYVDAFIEWGSKNIRKVITSLERLYDDDLKFSGEPDAIVLLNDSDVPTLIDIKATHAISKTWLLQLSAYKHLCNKNAYPVNRIMNIHLMKSKPPKYEEREGVKVLVSPPIIKAHEICYDAEDIRLGWEIFTSALNCYDYFYRKEGK